MKLTIFEFQNAPESLRILSQHGGDEDEIIVIDKELYDKDSYWFDNMIWRLDRYNSAEDTLHTTTFEGREVLVYITAHA